MFSIQAGHSVAVRRTAFAVLLIAGIFAAATAAVAAEAKQKAFATPEEAAKALVTAVKSGDIKAMQDILGPGSETLVRSGDAVADQTGRERFLGAYGEASKLARQSDAKAILMVGKDEWPLPIPIVRDSAGWRFDTGQGKEEILNRRIGRNELSTIQAVLAYVDAQR